MTKLSITLRITLWYSLLMLMIVLLVMGFMLSISDAVIQGDAQSRLITIVEDNATEVEYDDDELEIDSDFALFRNGVSALVYDDRFEVILGQLPAGFPEDTEFADGRTTKVTTIAEQFLVYDRRLSFYRYPDIWVRGVLPLDAVTGIAGSIFHIALVALPFLVVLTAVGGYLITRRAFRPVRAINQTVESITVGKDLSRRIPMGQGHDEIHALAANFNDMLQRLESAFEAEKQFVSDVSHELRTPVSVVLAQCEFALEQPEESAQEALQAIRRQAERMHRLIVHLLTVARLEEAGATVDLQDTDVSSLLVSLVEEAAILAPPHMAVCSNVPPGIRARIDMTLWTRLFQNLIQNAFKYGNEKVWVALGEQNGTIALRVSDDGNGIPLQEQPKIWQRFYQANPSRTAGETESMGLGLFMVKQIALLHHGKVTLESEPGNVVLT